MWKVRKQHLPREVKRGHRAGGGRAGRRHSSLSRGLAGLQTTRPFEWGLPWASAAGGEEARSAGTVTERHRKPDSYRSQRPFNCSGLAALPREKFTT